MTKYVGVAVMRLQPLHKGHVDLIKTMCENCHVPIVVIGSADKKITYNNPYGIEVRQNMVRNVFGKRVRVVPVDDLGITDVTRDWCDYILDKLDKVGLPSPTDYYTGSPLDGKYYEYSFWNKENPENIRDEHYTEDGVLRRINIVDRMNNNIPPATDLRKAILLNHNMWKDYVPRVNWDLTYNNFPAKYRFIN